MRGSSTLMTAEWIKSTGNRCVSPQWRPAQTNCGHSAAGGGGSCTLPHIIHYVIEIRPVNERSSEGRPIGDIGSPPYGARASRPLLYQAGETPALPGRCARFPAPTTGNVGGRCLQ